MTRKVWKFPVNVNEQGIDPVLHIPEGAQFLTLQFQQYDDEYMSNPPGSTIFDTWWSVDTINDPMDVQLHVRGTGDEIPPSVTYLGTIFPVPFVFHVFQKDLVFTDMHIVDGKFVPRSQ